MRYASSSRRSATCPTGSPRRRSWSGSAAADAAPAQPPGASPGYRQGAVFAVLLAGWGFGRIVRDGAVESSAAAIGSLIMSSARLFRGYVIAAAAGVSLALLLPAQAQFWGDWGGRPQRQQQYNNNWGGWGGGWNDR